MIFHVSRKKSWKNREKLWKALWAWTAFWNPRWKPPCDRNRKKFLKIIAATTRKKGKRGIFLSSPHYLKNTFLNLNREKIVKKHRKSWKKMSGKDLKGPESCPWWNMTPVFPFFKASDYQEAGHRTLKGQFRQRWSAAASRPISAFPRSSRAEWHCLWF